MGSPVQPEQPEQPVRFDGVATAVGAAPGAVMNRDNGTVKRAAFWMAFWTSAKATGAERFINVVEISSPNRVSTFPDSRG